MARHRIVPRSPSIDPGHLEMLRAGGVASVHESLGRAGLLDPALRPIWSGATIAGTAFTVLTEPDDNLMVHAAVEHCGPGDVLVVAVTAQSEHALVGELLATAFQSRGMAGLVVDAGVRDTATLRAMGFAVWSRLVSARGMTKEKAGSINVPVVCAGQAVHPGDAIVADDDGVVCVPRASVPDVARRTRERTEREAEKRALYASGTLSLDFYGLRDVLRELGVSSEAEEERR